MESRAVHFLDNRAHGEDRIVSRTQSDGHTIDAVFDGVSTANGGQAATICADYFNRFDMSSLEELREGFALVGHDLHVAHHSHGEPRMLTTGTVLLLGPDGGVVSAGDSPAYVYRQGTLYRITPLNRGAEPNVIMNALGIQREVPSYVRRFTTQPGDRIALVSDGVIDNLAPAELKQALSEPVPEDALDLLVSTLERKRKLNQGYTYGHFKNDDTSIVLRYVQTSDGPSLLPLCPHSAPPLSDALRKAFNIPTKQTFVYLPSGKLLLEEQDYTIGRGSDCDIVLPQAMHSASRLHGVIRYQDGDRVYEDLQSTFGTLLAFPTLEQPQRIVRVYNNALEEWRVERCESADLYVVHKERELETSVVPLESRTELYAGGRATYTEGLFRNKLAVAAGARIQFRTVTV